MASPGRERAMPRQELPRCFDPYLRYAIATDFMNFASFDPEAFRVFLLVEFKSLDKAAKFVNAIDKPEFAVEFSPVERKSLFTTMRALKTVVTNAFGDSSSDPETLFRIWDDNVCKVELSLPILPANGQPLIKRGLRKRAAGSPPERLIGILDDGCPFAAAQFLASGGQHTRVRGIWDQNQTLGIWDQGQSPNVPPPRQPIPLGPHVQFGEFVTDFNYGVEFLRDTTAGTTRVIGLDDWLKLHRSGAGHIDESGCYSDGGFETLKRQVSHGAHVMDVFAGRTPTSSRIARRDPPSWKPDTDLASRTDVVFVQFPDPCIRDATGVWLKCYVKDGIDYIMSYAEQGVTKNVTINLSYGPTTGPHDGTAELEDVLKDFITEFDGTQGKPKLDIVLAAGNAYLSEGHVAYARNQATKPETVSWTWRLPPNNSVLCFAEIWMDTSFASRTVVTLTSPSGIVYTPTPVQPPPSPGNPILPPFTGVIAPLPWGNSTVWLLAVQPTGITPAAAAPPTISSPPAEHGDWTITVEYIDLHAKVHAYVARSDPNMGVRTGAKRSYFVDPVWEQTHGASAALHRNDGEFDKHGSLVHRHGTLNGIATAKLGRIHVAGGYTLSTGRKSPYSSAGPARGGSRLGPDFALPTDESCALQGIRGGGNRSGAVFRLTGTSTAAPQLARDVTDAAPLQPTNIPGTPSEIGKRGGGNLAPP